MKLFLSILAISSYMYAGVVVCKTKNDLTNYISYVEEGDALAISHILNNRCRESYDKLLTSSEEDSNIIKIQLSTKEEVWIQSKDIQFLRKL